MAELETGMEDLFPKINLNSDIRQIAEYILTKYKDITSDVAIEVAKYLILEKKYFKEDILQGKADDDLAKRLHTKIIELNSVRKEEEKDLEIPLKTFKRKTKKEEIKRLAILIAGLAATVMILGVKYNEYNDERIKEETTINLGLLASEVGSDDYLNKRNIVIQSAINPQDREGNTIPRFVALADDIISICIKDPSLFDITVYDTYYHINQDRLDNFNTTWDTLKNYFTNDEAFNVIYSNKINKSFLNYVLDMLVANDKVKYLDSEYQKYMSVVIEYQNVQKFEELSKPSKVILLDMMNKYQELGQNFYRDNNENIEYLVTEQTKEAESRGR